VAEPALARLAAFVPLALFGAMHWAGLLRPAAGLGAVATVAAATAGGGALIATGSIASRRLRLAALGATTLAMLVIAVLSTGIPLRLLVPDAWDDLAAGLAEGIAEMPGVTVPYRGVDEWVRSAIMLGGTLLTVLAALAAFWPDRAGTRREPGFPLPAAIVLSVLYGVPIVEHGPDRPYLGGAIFCLLLGAFLWLERLRADQVGVAAVCLLGAALVGLIVAPRLDGARPWLDYEQIAERLEPTTSERFVWDHRYGPLDWPREGREVVRIKARTSAYWKAATLDDFDGVRWQHTTRVPGGQPDTEIDARHPEWTDTVRVVFKGLISREYVGAGTILDLLPPRPRQPSYENSPGTWVAVPRPLRRGSSYRLRVYYPRPSPTDLRTASEEYPAFTYPYLSMELPFQPGLAPVDALTDRRILGSVLSARFAPYTADGPGAEPVVSFPSGYRDHFGASLMDRSRYRRTWRLAQRLRAESSSAYDFVVRVRDRVQQDAAYSESPAPSRVPLETFLFDDRAGYCQQFSGAMALLLRMGGVPARVASGFSPGKLDRTRGEFIVRDLDAHSWVEAYFPGYGWITFDPTPAIAPARSQADESGGGDGAGAGTRGESVAGDRPGDGPGGQAAAGGQDGGPDPVVVGVLGLLAAGLVGGGARAVVRRGRVPGGPLGPDVAELQRALHRTGRTPPPSTTLASLEASLGGSRAARAYLSAVRRRRFAGRGQGPTAAERRALRHELAAGLGLRGRLRAWWALPPGRGR
jgi:transglutaminase-like putative cysteine protease